MLQVPGWNLGLRGEVLGRDALPMLVPAWQDLCGRAAEDNVYYSPRYACALLDSVERDKNVSFAVVWDQSSLVALLPFTRPAFRIPVLQPAARAWLTKYTFSCMPLLDRERKTDAAGVLLDVLASISPSEWIIPTVNVQGDACQSLVAILAQRGLPWTFVEQFQRAILETDETFDDYVKRHVLPKRLKGLSRNRRRLEELGKVEHQTHRFGDGLDRAVAAFLEIEASGWKGKRGTALACDERTKQFALDAFTGGEARSICRADVLTLDGKAIAVSLVALSGRTGFAVKSCYDETYRSQCAGLLVELELVRSFLSEKWAKRLDSATAGAHVLDELWSGRVEVGDLIFSLAPRCPWPRLSALRATDRTTRKIRAGLKRALTRLRPT